MKPYIVRFTTGLAIGFAVGKIPETKQWDISLSLIFFMVGLRSKHEVTQDDFEETVEGIMKEWEL